MYWYKSCGYSCTATQIYSDFPLPFAPGENRILGAMLVSLECQGTKLNEVAQLSYGFCGFDSRRFVLPRVNRFDGPCIPPTKS